MRAETDHHSPQPGRCVEALPTLEEPAHCGSQSGRRQRTAPASTPAEKRRTTTSTSDMSGKPEQPALCLRLSCHLSLTQTLVMWASECCSLRRESTDRESHLLSRLEQNYCISRQKLRASSWGFSTSNPTSIEDGSCCIPTTLRLQHAERAVVLMLASY